MEKSSSTVGSQITALPEDNLLIDIFWKAYKEDFRAFKLYNSSKQDRIVENFKRLNPTSKINLQTIIDGVTADANAENESKYDIDMERALEWSEENIGVKQMIMKMGYTPKTTLSKPFLLEYYTKLSFTNRKITHITPLPFANLKELSLIDNNIFMLTAGMPAALEVLVLYGNQIDVIDPRIILPNLQYLNLGLNKLTNNSFDDESGVAIQDSFPQLISLDLSYNNIKVLNDLMTPLTEVKSLRMLGLEGNPFCILRNWKKVVEEELKQIKVLDLVDLKEDDESVHDAKADTFQALMSNMWGESWAEEAAEQREEEEREAAKGGAKGGKKKDKKGAKGKKGAKEDKKGKKDAKGKGKKPAEPRKSTAKKTESNAHGETLDGNNSSRISGHNLISSSLVFEGKGKKDFTRYLNLKFEIKTLENIKPVYLEDLETEENKEDLSKLQQSYWFKYEFMSEECTSESSKLYHKDCMSMPPVESGEETFHILDFNSELDLELQINKDLQIALYKNIVIKLYTKYPKIKKPESDEDQPEEPEIEIHEELLGFTIVRLEDFLNDPELKYISRKYAVFEYDSETVFQNSELYWPLPDEELIVAKSKDKIEAITAKKYAPKKEEEAEVEVQTKGKGRGGKKQKKKPQKAKPKKTKATEEEAPKVQILDWENDSRTAIPYKDDFLGRQDIMKNKNNKFFVSGLKKLAVKISIL